MISSRRPQPSRWRLANRILSITIGLYLISSAGSVLAWQSQNASQPIPGTKLSFEVASIKPSNPRDHTSSISMSGGRFEVRNFSVSDLIGLGYNTDVSSAPNWIDSARYDIKAKMSDDDYDRIKDLNRYAQYDQIRLMVRSLLTDRFQLAADLKPAPVMGYALVVAGRGPKLRRSNPSLDARSDVKQEDAHWVDIDLKGAPLSLLAAQLAGYFQAKMVDETHLAGYYDIRLTVDQPIDETPGDEAGALNAALQTQLGLEAKYRKIVINTVFVRQIERPSPD
jgi:uncharacterized protein (TIGR03435 family)